METVEEVLKTVGRTVGIPDLTLGGLLRVVMMVLLGILAIRLLMKMVDRMLERSKSVAAIKPYIHTAVNIFLWVLLALMLALVAVVSCSGCSYKVSGVKNYPLIDIYACQNTIKKHSYRK